MADLIDQAHADAGLALLRADTTLTVYDGSRPSTAVPPYVLVYTTIERPPGAADTNLGGASSKVTVRWYCHCVGANAAAARAVAMRVRAALLDVRPVIAGRDCGLIRQDAVAPPSRDETTGVVVMDAIAVYRLSTNPA